ncbi:MAG: Uma2 family endonuclease [Pirellulales bacterium]|nr:Uma2 family endonuclease [Pirellulales bacterium]
MNEPVVSTSTTQSAMPAPAEQPLVEQAPIDLGDSVVTLDDIGWDLYVKLCDASESRHVRMYYDDGVLEMMSPSRLHERWARMTARFLDVVAEELDLNFQSCGSMTVRRKDRRKGFEPDNCYYLTHEPQLRVCRELDFEVDPPPDLAIEVDLQRRFESKLPIYEAFKVPELWNYDGRALRVYQLQSSGGYLQVESSHYFPVLALSEIERRLPDAVTGRETTVLRDFRAWVRANLIH